MSEKKSEFKLYKSPENFYSIIIPRKWEVIVVEGVPAFFERDGDGVLQIYAFKNLNNDFNIDAEMEKYLFEQHNIEDFDKILDFINKQKYQIRFYEFLKENRFWMIYMLSNKEKMILSTYNGDTKPDLLKLESVHLAIDSIIFLNS